MTTLALNVVNSISLPKVNWKAVCFFGFFMCLAVLFFYVWQINSLAAGSYLVDKYDKEIFNLLEENKALKISFAQSNYLDRALLKIKELNFQKATSVKYIQVSDNPTNLTFKK